MLKCDILILFESKYVLRILFARSCFVIFETLRSDSNDKRKHNLGICYTKNQIMSFVI